LPPRPQTDAAEAEAADAADAADAAATDSKVRHPVLGSSLGLFG